MNVSCSVLFSELLDSDFPPEFRPFVQDLVHRLDVAFQQVLTDLHSQPTVFPLDPADPTNEELLKGANPGDVAIYNDETGVAQVHVFE